MLLVFLDFLGVEKNYLISKGLTYKICVIVVIKNESSFLVQKYS